MGPKNPRSSLLTLPDEAIILAYRWRTRLALDDAHLRLKRLMPNLSRSTLYRCLKRRGLSRIGSTKPVRRWLPQLWGVPTALKLPLEEVASATFTMASVYALRFSSPSKRSGKIFMEIAVATPENATAFLVNLVAQFAEKIVVVARGIRPAFIDSGGGMDRA
jgi:hypothetical protein